MKKISFLLIIAIAFSMGQCKPKESDNPKEKVTFIKQNSIDTVLNRLSVKYSDASRERIEKGVKQIADLWTSVDGTSTEFEDFCVKSYVNDENQRLMLFKKLSQNFEALFGHFNIISLNLKRGMHIDIGEQTDIDLMFGSYEPGSHINDDFYANKIAFVVALNFPFYSLKEKQELGPKWSRNEWSYARLGDFFTSRVPAEISQKAADATTASDNYISNYNIYMGNLLNDKGDTLFPKDMKLISHWNLRDELKANYNKGNPGLTKQNMIYEVMLHIIKQDIPADVINNPDLKWNPVKNVVFKDGKETTSSPEPDTRYEFLLNNFKAMKAVDKYTPMYPTYIMRAFDAGMELPQEQVEMLFTNFCSSAEVKEVGKLISNRLGRPLKPFDIWYDGFKARSGLDQSKLDKQTMSKYPNVAAFEKDIPNILLKLGFSAEKSKEIGSHITVDAARGSGHAWGAAMKGDKSHLRTRIGKAGMDYKGYNIAMHELGHNVEQTISMYFVDDYVMSGVPNTAFTEAYAFAFQKHDLEVLGIKDTDPNKEAMNALDNFWASYEIMGVSLVDMKVWKWLYANPEATKGELKEQVIASAKEVWNTYYAEVFGEKDVPLLAIYSHMIDNPLYLSNYPVGHIIEFQLDQHFKGKNFAEESMRIYSSGRLIPQSWMKNAVGSELSIQPLISATADALKIVK